MNEAAPRIPQPNYTQIPNVFFDEIMPQLKSLAEIKVMLVVMRQTFGYHKRNDLLSLSQIQKLSGLSRQAAIDGIKGALEKGILLRKEQGDSYRYAVHIQAPKTKVPIVNDLDHQESEVVKNLDQCGSQEFRPVLVKNLDRKVVKNLDTQKKVLNKKESTTSKEVVDDAQAASSPKEKPKSKKKPTGLPANHPTRLEIARAWMKDLESPATLAKEYSQIADATRRFVAMGEPPEIIQKIEECWYAFEFRGQKGEPPAPPDLLATYQKMKVGKYKENQTNGTQSHHNQPQRLSPRNANNEAAAQRFLARKGISIPAE
jgi:hypothetical protein